MFNMVTQHAHHHFLYLSYILSFYMRTGLFIFSKDWTKKNSSNKIRKVLMTLVLKYVVSVSTKSHVFGLLCENCRRTIDRQLRRRHCIFEHVKKSLMNTYIVIPLMMWCCVIWGSQQFVNLYWANNKIPISFFHNIYNDMLQWITTENKPNWGWG